MIRPIVLFTARPTQLRRVSMPVAEADFGTEDLHALCEDLSDTMHAQNGLGLSAIQIGIPKRVFVLSAILFGSRDTDEAIAFCNPEIVGQEGTQRGSEGCLSFPGAHVMADAPATLAMRARYADGRAVEGPMKDLAARAFAHECDHLDGRLLVDRLGRLERDTFLKDVVRSARKPRRQVWQ